MSTEATGGVTVGWHALLERNPAMRRVWAMPSADTFDVAPIAGLVRKYLRGVSVDPFARNKRWATHTNDLDPATEAEHHMDAVDFLAMLDERGIAADFVILDPPYSPRQISECYAQAQPGLCPTEKPE